MKKNWINLRLWFLTFIISVSVAKAGFGQLRQPSPSSAELYASIKKLNVLGSVLYFAAHPDDENTRLIAWLAKEKHYRTAYLSLTRGDGGQNLIGTELAHELGLIRTQELLLARSIDGGEQYFSRANDFGFSKTPEETLEFWGKDAVLADAVWIIRLLKPDVIITRFPPDARGGHGHHQAATILAIEAFRAAADPNRFPEQLQYGVEPWQATRLLWNTANFGGQNNTSPDQFKIDIGDYNPLLGKSYGEIASESRSSHKTQGFGAARQRGFSQEFFELLDGTPPKNELLDGVVTSWDRVPGANGISSHIQQIADGFDFTHPENSVPALLELLTHLEALPKNYWTDIKRREVKDLILACSGIWLEASAAQALVAQGDSVQVQTEVIVRRPKVQVQVAGLCYGLNEQGAIYSTPIHGEAGQILPFNRTLAISGTFPALQITQPYWLRAAREREMYTVDRQEEVGSPENHDDPKIYVDLLINQKKIRYERPIVYRFTDPVRGEVHQPLSVAPPVTATFKEQALVFANGASRTLDVAFTSHKAGSYSLIVKPEVPKGWTISPETLDLSFSSNGEEQIKTFTIQPSTSKNPFGAASAVGQLKLHFVAPGMGSVASNAQALMIRQINHDHVPLITYFPEASLKLSAVEVQVPAKQIAYIPGAGDLVPEALKQIGLDIVMLDEAALKDQDLSKFAAIVAGVRLYNVEERVGHIHKRIMEYVSRGGVYVVQYQVNTNLKSQELGPYPFGLNRSRVTEEDAEVRFLQPHHPIFHYPNKITAADFQGWVQERGLYFTTNVDPRYAKPLSMNDQGEPGSDGSLLVTQYGKGKYVYTSLAFFRQLPAGVPGAYRLFMNLIAPPQP